MEIAGADILFAAGNCGSECPDGRCKGVTDRAIYGVNSHRSVLCIGAVTTNKVRLGYSSQGPGRSAACPVASGVVAAIRSALSPTDVTPAQLRCIIRQRSEDVGEICFEYSHGFGVIDVPGILLATGASTPVPQEEVVSGTLTQRGDTARFQLTVGEAFNTLAIELDGPEGADFDLYVKKGSVPTLTDYDARGYTSSADERILVQPIEPGEYYILVHSYRGSGDFTIKTVRE